MQGGSPRNDRGVLKRIPITVERQQTNQPYINSSNINNSELKVNKSQRGAGETASPPKDNLQLREKNLMQKIMNVREIFR